ncbi:MAG: 30S ribosomal protein S20 [Parcubacteria group bacterium ADurb.Bin159]|jgi:ribosomal protein S20|nr:MAG: 30S ribosomal protein S20 [Parcubacteria group bacterium ADurb.Bin159]
MPIRHAAVKSLRQTKKRTEYNKKIKKNLGYLERQFLKLVKDNSKRKEAEETYKKLQIALDKAAKRGIIKPNKRDRKKSRLSAILNKMANQNIQK